MSALFVYVHVKNMKRVQLQFCPVLTLGAELLPRPTVNLSHSFPHQTSTSAYFHPSSHPPIHCDTPRRFSYASRKAGHVTDYSRSHSPTITSTIMLKAYKNLSPKTRLGVGIAIIAWGAGGLMLTDPLEKSLGLTPTEEDKAELDKYTPKITTVDKNEKDGN
ncbi:hypothetical protein NW765_003239 [Fusarium oxysporum]|uniref:Uncharacterized protein n=4 Tax=Fusarium oxysporum TaxID=5507 RepID=A0A420QJX5_FUSOX|nr:hypothetical protein NW765_003239 [Fusarium oxysporum]RKL05069.1 hypothetical protein BFJ71_g3308 [Fusarium oxysporum]RKL15715.1 hypothetical protein BFJ68_g5482 [Fusarium oxysporum]